MRGRLSALLDRLPTGSDETDGREAVTATMTPPQSAAGGVFEAASIEALEPPSSLVGWVQACAEPGRPEPGDIVQAAPRKFPAPARPKRERQRHPWALTAGE
ncbi:hypothetical protein [Streptomyces humidus]